MAASVVSCDLRGMSSDAMLETVIHVLAEVIHGGVRFAAKSFMEGFDALNKGSEKVDEALRELRQRDFVEILVCAVWHDGVLTETERARFLGELREIEADALSELLESSLSADARDDEALEAHVRGLAEGFTDAQRAYTLDAVARVLQEAPAAEPEAAGAYRSAVRPAGGPGAERSLALFRRALRVR